MLRLACRLLLRNATYSVHLLECRGDGADSMRMPVCYLQEASWPVKAEHLDLALDEWRYAQSLIAPILPVKEGRGCCFHAVLLFQCQSHCKVATDFFYASVPMLVLVFNNDLALIRHDNSGNRITRWNIIATFHRLH